MVAKRFVEGDTAAGLVGFQFDEEAVGLLVSICDSGRFTHDQERARLLLVLERTFRWALP